MKHTTKVFWLGQALVLATAAVLMTSGPAAAQTSAEVRPLQSSTNYTAGATLSVRCEITFPAGRQVLSLLWTPSLPDGWTLTGTATGDGEPEVDPDGLAIVFNAANLSVNNPFVFHYTVNVPAGESGARILSGVAEYQLDGMANPVPSGSPPLVLADVSASHAAVGYIAGTPMTVTCSFVRPAGVTLYSLLWQPVFPSADWQLVSGTEAVSGDGGPEVDPDGQAIVFMGDLSSTILTFSYTVLVPEGTTGPQTIDSVIEYQLDGMTNPAETSAEPDPLTVLPLYTLEIVSPCGTGLPGVGVITNCYGTLLTNHMDAVVTDGVFQYGCAGWLLAGNEPTTGIGNECQLVLTNNAVLTWVWGVPVVGAHTVDEMATLAFQADDVAYSQEAFLPRTVTYALDADSLTAGMTITADGAFSWTPDETQGGQSYEVTVTITAPETGSQAFNASKTFTIDVAEVNRAPVLDALSDQVADAQSTLTFIVTATDPDIPAQTLSFSLDEASLALGMAIDATTGVFSWSPTVEQAGVGQSYTVSITVADDGALSDTKSFTIAVVDSRGEHTTEGGLPGSAVRIDCTFAHPADKTLISLLWRPILPAGWSLLSVAGQAAPKIDASDGTIIFLGSSADLNTPNPLTFSYWVSVPTEMTGPQTIRSEAEYQIAGMANPLTVTIFPDPLPVPVLLTLPELVVSDKTYDGLTNATVSTYGALGGLMDGHTDVSLVTTSSVAFFDTPEVGQEKRVVVYGLALEGADASWYAISTQVVAAAVTPMPLMVGGSFTVVEKIHDGTTIATIDVNELTLLTPVAGDDVVLSPVVAFDSAGVGEGKPVMLTDASTLTGADAGNYTLSLEGAPMTTGTVRLRAIGAVIYLQ